MNKRLNKSINEQTNEWMNKRVNEWVNKWTTGWTKDLMNEWKRWMNERLFEPRASVFSPISINFDQFGQYIWSKSQKSLKYASYPPLPQVSIPNFNFKVLSQDVQNLCFFQTITMTMTTTTTCFISVKIVFPHHYFANMDFWVTL